ncbi:MAG TPA: glycosyltransferase family protein [Acidobacteriota bacterium]|nr:glycosyltransferase family protein [Acidobacteriota bacterium]
MSTKSKDIIFFGVSGEGHGHATRCAAVATELQKTHRIIFFASHKSYTYLKSKFDEVYEIYGLELSHRNGAVSILGTAWVNIPLLDRAKKTIRDLVQKIDELNPKLIISDFEPFIARAALKCKRNYITFDNQQILHYADLNVPWSQKYYFGLAKGVISYFYPKKPMYSITTFLAPMQLNAPIRVDQCGPVSGKMLKASKKKSNDVVVYLRSSAHDHVLKLLQTLTHYKFHVYGIPPGESKGNMIYYGISHPTFEKNLAKCKAVIATAGLSLASEIVILGKPIFCIPEKNDFEQYLNAITVERENFGTWSYSNKITIEKLNDFLERKWQITPQKNAVSDVVKKIRKLL